MWAQGIDDLGRIVGLGTGNNTPSYAILWANASSAPAPRPQGGFSTNALGMSGDGKIVGVGYSAGSQSYLYWSSPTADPVPVPSGNYSGNLTGINRSGQIVGFGCAGAAVCSSAIALFWSDPTSAPVHCRSAPSPIRSRTRINDQGEIVGSSQGSGPAVWANHASEPVGLSSGAFLGTVAYSVNASGAIVGTARGCGP